MDNSTPISVGVYGPTLSGKTLLIERLADPEVKMTLASLTHDEAESDIEFKTVSEDSRFVFHDVPSYELPIEGKFDRYVIVVNRREELWKSYYEAALQFLERPELILVYSIKDSKNVKRTSIMESLEKDVLVMSSYTGDSCSKVLQVLEKSNQERLSEFRKKEAVKKKRKAKKRSGKRQTDDDGWTQV